MQSITIYMVTYRTTNRQNVTHLERVCSGIGKEGNFNMKNTNNVITKKDEQWALNQAKESIQKEFIHYIGFAPQKKDIIPLECSWEYFKPDNCTDGVWLCENLAFAIGGLGYVLDGLGKVIRAEWYDLNND